MFSSVLSSLRTDVLSAATGGESCTVPHCVDFLLPFLFLYNFVGFATTNLQGCWNAKYKANHIIRHFHPVSLNPSHTHFLLVDDGHRGRYGGVADFRAKLERKISLPITAAPGAG